VCRLNDRGIPALHRRREVGSIVGKTILNDVSIAIVSIAEVSISEVPIAATMTSRSTNSTARIDRLIGRTTERDFGAMCDHFVSATTREHIPDHNERYCRHIKDTTPDQQYAIADIGKRSSAIYVCAAFGKIWGTTQRKDTATHLHTATDLGTTTDLRTATNFGTATYLRTAWSTRIAKHKTAVTVTVTMTEMGRAKMITGGYNATDHGESRQQTDTKCGYVDPFHSIPHIFGGIGEPLSIP
jgi:hypothetical protein